MLNGKDIVYPKVEGQNAHKNEVKTRQNSRFLENSKKSVSRNSHSSTHSQNSFTPTKILKRPSNTPSHVAQKEVVSPTQKKWSVNSTSIRNTSPQTVSFAFVAKSDGIIFKPWPSKSTVPSSKPKSDKKQNFYNLLNQIVCGKSKLTLMKQSLR